MEGVHSIPASGLQILKACSPRNGGKCALLTAGIEIRWKTCRHQGMRVGSVTVVSGVSGSVAEAIVDGRIAGRLPIKTVSKAVIAMWSVSVARKGRANRGGENNRHGVGATLLEEIASRFHSSPDFL